MFSSLFTLIVKASLLLCDTCHVCVVTCSRESKVCRRAQLKTLLTFQQTSEQVRLKELIGFNYFQFQKVSLSCVSRLNRFIPGLLPGWNVAGWPTAAPGYAGSAPVPCLDVLVSGGGRTRPGQCTAAESPLRTTKPVSTSKTSSSYAS